MTGKYNETEAAEGRFDAKTIASLRQKGLLTRVDRVSSVARELGCTPAQLALAYCLKNDQVSSLLFGATRTAQVTENVQALEMLPRLDHEVLAKLRS